MSAELADLVAGVRAEWGALSDEEALGMIVGPVPAEWSVQPALAVALQLVMFRSARRHGCGPADAAFEAVIRQQSLRQRLELAAQQAIGGDE